MQQLKYKRVLIKLSGEALMGTQNKILDPEIIQNIVQQIKQLLALNVQIALVIGAGNIFRGTEAKDFALNHISADYMGILATIMNGIAFKDLCMNNNIPTKLYSAIHIPSIADMYNRDDALNHLEKNTVVIFTAGTGNPLFTTDSAAALRAIEMNVDILIKATKVDGIYNKDPLKFSDAIKYEQITFNDAIEKKLKIMDLTAFDLCKQYNMQLQVCNIFDNEALVKIIHGNNIGTYIGK